MSNHLKDGHLNLEDRQIIVNRTFDAPRELVFNTWTDPIHIGNWWGPNGFTITTHEMDVKPGGTWKFMMHGPYGVDYPNRIEYIEVVEPEKIVYKHGSGEENDPAQFEVTVTFIEQDGKTLLTMCSLFASVEERNNVIEFGAIEGGKQTLDRLAAHIQEKINS